MKNVSQKNNVPAVKQNKKSFYSFKEGTSLRVLFVGNSITKHSPKPEINWFNDCGMAASSADKDYVHILMNKIQGVDSNSAFAVLQVAEFEFDFEKYDIKNRYSEARDFNADIIIMFFGANVNKQYGVEYKPETTFKEKYKELREYLDASGNALVLHSEGFYIRPILNEEKKSVAAEKGDKWIELGDIAQREDTHDSTFNHPNDLGMAEIAERFWQALKDSL